MTARSSSSGFVTSSATGGSRSIRRSARRFTRRGRSRSRHAIRESTGLDAQVMHSDDGLILRLPDGDEPPSADLVLLAAEDVEQIVQTEVGGSALFASRFRECAARALLLPRRDPTRRTPLWQQRQRSAQLLSVASIHPDFPIVLEAVRECLQDVFDVPGLVG